jgi:DHA2 family multidrug resistance protein
MIGFIEAFGFVTLSFLLLIPLVLLLRKQGDSPRRSPI